MENASFFCEMLEKHLQLLTEKASVKGLSYKNVCMITDHMRDLARLYKEICLIEKLEPARSIGDLAQKVDALDCRPNGNTAEPVSDQDTASLCQEIVSRVKEVKETRHPVEVASLLATGNWIVLSAVSGFEEGKEYGFFALGRIR